MCGGTLEKSSNSESDSDHIIEQKPQLNSSGTEIWHEETGDSCNLLELASNNDLKTFQRYVDEGSMKVDKVEMWYMRENGTRKMVLEERTPLMIAAMYGSLDVLKYIVEMYTKVGGDINKACGSDHSTALHCAASGGSIFSEETVLFLLDSGANLNSLDAYGRRAVDVISVSDRSSNAKITLEELLNKEKPSNAKIVWEELKHKEKSCNAKIILDENLHKGKICSAMIVSEELLNTGKASNENTLLEEVLEKEKICNANIVSVELVNKKKPLDRSVDFPDRVLEDCFLPSSFDDIGLIATVENEEFNTSVSSSTLSIASSGSYPSSLSSPSSSPKSPKNYMTKVFRDGSDKVKDYLIDPSLPDIKSNIYTTDEFRMYSFKIRPCSRAYSHDWTECPFAHPGENARRRDPRRYHYSCVPCPDFRKGECHQGDSCEYAHGVFECWLHPAQYRTRLCKDGKECNRRVCFFAHVVEELRPLYLSTGSAIPSPKSSAFSEVSPISSPRGASSSSMMTMHPPFSPSFPHYNIMHGNLATPPMSPSVPTLHLPGGAIHANSGNSRLKAPPKTHEVSLTDLIVSPDIDSRWLNEFQSFSTSGQSLSAQARVNAAVAASRNGSFSESFRNVEHIAIASTNSNKSRNGSLSRCFRNVEHSVAPTNLDELFAMESISSSPHSPMPESVSPLDRHFVAMKLAHHQAQLPSAKQVQAHMQARKPSVPEGQLNSPRLLSPRTPKLASFDQMATIYGNVNVDLHSFDEVPSTHSPRSFTPNSVQFDCNQPEWVVHEETCSRLRNSVFPGFGDVEEPDLSWIQKLVKEEQLDTVPSNGAHDDMLIDSNDIDISSWVENLHLDEKWPVQIATPRS